MTTAPDQHVAITVTGDCGHVLGTWTDEIEDKYPFYCEECDDDKRTGRYPWKLTTRIVAAPDLPALPVVKLPAGPLVCTCGHGFGDHAFDSLGKPKPEGVRDCLYCECGMFAQSAYTLTPA